MNTLRSDPYIRELYDFAARRGFSESTFFGRENQESYIRTAVDAYRDYALFRHVFQGQNDEKLFSKMMAVDFASRMAVMAGLAASDAYESVMLLEPPGAKKTGMPDYFRAADLPSYTLLIHPEMYKLTAFEKYARKVREPFMDNKTWYLYIFATQKQYQNMGYGKKLMETVLSFADSKECRICLETNEPDNVELYRHFGFTQVHYARYQGKLGHYVMLRKKVTGR